jgi:hypothetical protein
MRGPSPLPLLHRRALPSASAPSSPARSPHPRQPAAELAGPSPTGDGAPAPIPSSAGARPARLGAPPFLCRRALMPLSSDLSSCDVVEVDVRRPWRSSRGEDWDPGELGHRDPHRAWGGAVCGLAIFGDHLGSSSDWRRGRGARSAAPSRGAGELGGARARGGVSSPWPTIGAAVASRSRGGRPPQASVRSSASSSSPVGP